MLRLWSATEMSRDRIGQDTLHCFPTPVIVLALALALSVSAGPTRAQTLAETLAHTYRTNPQLEADRARQRSTDSDVARALGGYRPNVQFQMEGGRGKDAIQYDYLTPPQYIPATPGKHWETNTERATVLQIVQPVYDGGRASADVRHAKLSVKGGLEQMRSVEQSVLGDAIQGYLDLYRDQQILELSKGNVGRLTEELADTRTRFRVQDVTQTDVAQAESRLARGISDQTAAEGSVIASISNFTRVSGLVPGQLPPPPPLPPLPASLDEVLAHVENNPDIRYADDVARVAEADVEFVESGLLPTVSLRGEDRRTFDAAQRGVNNESQDVVLTLSVPLYEGGVSAARTREQKHIAAQRRLETDLARRRTVDQAKRAWQALTTSRSRLKALGEQLRSARVALDSIKAEVRVGTRTVLDQLNAEQELLDAQVGVARARHDEAVGAYSLLVAIGKVSARDLGVPVDLYDPGEHNKAETGRWFGTGTLNDYDEDRPKR
jgi:TolC family type I secretion outer membrane protein